MIVEIKKLNKSNSKNISEFEKITQQTQLEEKRIIKEEKDLAKRAKLEEKRRIKEEKDLAKQIERDETSVIKKEKSTSKQSVDIITDSENAAIASTNFKKLVEKITKKNIFRPYPDINDIPN